LDIFPVHSYPIILEKAQQLGIPAEAMSEETHEVAVAELENIQKITALKSNETEKEKITYTIDAIFEAQDLRTVYLNEKKYNLVDNRWEEGTKKADYYSYKAKATYDDKGNKQIEKVN